MCGIAGIVGPGAVTDLARLAGDMNAAIAHRGPDDCGLHLVDGVAFAMRRLSIIDIAGGHQPMRTPDGVSLVFNGEIYNYLDLRGELSARGYTFTTRSDTEVILNLYHAQGIDGLKRLHGMFAIAIHDARTRRIILMRDQIGIKPLYYRTAGDTLMFASEIKAILAALSGRPRLDPQAVWDYLTLRYVPPARTIWEGICKLEPGHVLEYCLDARTCRTFCYWSANLTPEPYDAGRDYAGEFEEQLLAAVQSHIVASDVPVGAFLSGGLDSGALCAASIELGHQNLHTFSISGEDAGSDDELPLARLVSRSLGSHHHELVMRREHFFDALDKVAWHFDEPYGDASGVAVLLLSQAARQHVKVAMSGEGSDELLLGYAKPSDLEALAAIERRVRRWPRAALCMGAPLFGDRRRNILAALGVHGPRAYSKAAAQHISATLSDAEKARFWRGGQARPSRDLISSWYTLPVTLHPFVQAQQADFRSWLVEDLLMKADKMGMAASLEVRVPFLHLPLVEWCQRSPLELRIGHVQRGEFRSKAVLRDFVARRLPDDILKAPKRGFPLPIFVWFRDSLRQQRAFLPRSRAIHDWVDVRKLDLLLAAGMAGERRALEKLWNILMLDRWLAVYVD